MEPDGRRPGDDVVDIALRVVMGKLLPLSVAPSGQLPFTDGALVNAGMFQQAFPYINPPLPGSPNDLSVTFTLQGSGSVNGPFVNTSAKYNGSNSTISTVPTGGNSSFYRTKSDPAEALSLPIE